MIYILHSNNNRVDSFPLPKWPKEWSVSDNDNDRPTNYNWAEKRKLRLEILEEE